MTSRFTPFPDFERPSTYALSPSHFLVGYDGSLAIRGSKTVYTLMMERFNSEGIRRSALTIALKDRRQVMEARRVDACMLCRRSKVNDSGLCDLCYSGLEGEEFRLAMRWLSGVGP